MAGGWGNLFMGFCRGDWRGMHKNIAADWESNFSAYFVGILILEYFSFG
jgi:hypothetical protein